ncbi:MAG TPA: TetR/AcrR family transcriptional regulator [Anaeromyxobacteraceae bacterium]|nr:TetR/AcrR family transcriptional regulator [Anaeromyxobacteraceae bacterium]
MKSRKRTAPGPARATRRPVAKRAGAFHHGDLEWAILEAASQLLEKEGPLGVGLRAAARLAGVSHTAPYRHFENRESILAALAERGLLDLADRIAAAARGRANALESLAAIAETYVTMASERPHRFRLMFGPELAGKERHPAVRDAGLRAHHLLVATIVEGQRQGIVRAGDPVDLALAHWSTVHGMASLLVDGLLTDRAQAPGGPAALGRLAAEQIRLGLAPRP